MDGDTQPLIKKWKVSLLVREQHQAAIPAAIGPLHHNSAYRESPMFTGLPEEQD
jgi:hypothetical protein